MDQLASFLKPELLALSGAVILALRTIWNIFHDERTTLPAIPFWILPLAIVLMGFVLAFTEHAIHPSDPGQTRMLADLWPLQGLFLAAVMLIADQGLVRAYSSPRGVTGPGTVVPLVLGLLALTLIPSPTWASDAPPRWSLKRAAFAVAAQGAIYDSDDEAVPRQSGFLPMAGLSYSLSEHLSAAAAAEGDFARDLYWFRGGGRFQTSGTETGSRLHSYIGVDYIHYYGDGSGGIAEPDSWETSIRGAWSAIQKKVVAGDPNSGRTSVYGTLALAYDPENHRHRLTVGLQWVPFGQ